jgi:hypothetical protein
MSRNDFAEFISKMGYKISVARMVEPWDIWIIIGKGGMKMFPVRDGRSLYLAEAKVLKWLLDA